MFSFRAPYRLPFHVEIAALVILAALGLSVRCSAGLPTAPTPSSAVASLALVPRTEQLAVGDIVDLTMIASLRNGSTAIMSPVWGSDNGDVLMVKPLSTSRTGEWEDKPEVIDHYLRGQVTARRPGGATVFAECAHGRAEQTILVVAR